jgi:formamidopyrimidine-DNA glycosylase
MDQTVVAGLGNLLADEITWRAGLHPARPANEVSSEEYARLYRTMRGVLRRAISYGRIPDLPSWLTGHRDEEGAPCPRCGTPFRRSRIGGRTTVWCPRCQPRAHES